MATDCYCDDINKDIVIKLQSLIRGHNTRILIKKSFLEFNSICQDIEKIIQEEQPSYRCSLVNKGKVGFTISFNHIYVCLESDELNGIPIISIQNLCDKKDSPIELSSPLILPDINIPTCAVSTNINLSNTSSDELRRELNWLEETLRRRIEAIK